MGDGNGPLSAAERMRRTRARRRGDPDAPPKLRPGPAKTTARAACGKSADWHRAAEVLRAQAVSYGFVWDGARWFRPEEEPSAPAAPPERPAAAIPAPVVAPAAYAPEEPAQRCPPGQCQWVDGECAVCGWDGY